ncbi:multidrug resistance efflux transporter family protein [Geobacillus thermoleovorans]|uniref:Multidrug resistance efflux transporter family protein n=2 Tax=Geobacillus TaxID=129337 RepID=A0A2Z3NDM9_GEOTH|nr:multidrug resistance efflux transporter family protein [Geobacillus thermoleovorans]QCK82909.1 multidrug resistance efflux transporter family protein [Geobacillus kaustophilus NBRC 102445]UPT59384.1 multidrug resistance efflux transporter family protein [Geobacillus thermoleovorans]
MREMALGLAASFFFAVTFILNRSMELAGGSWTWSSSLRFFFMVPLLFVILLAHRNLGPVWRDMKRHPWTWIVWGTVGFGLFYAPLTYAAAYGPGWLVAGTWQCTIVAGVLLSPLFTEQIETQNGTVSVRRPIEKQALFISFFILLGVVLVQFQQAGHLTWEEIALGIFPVLIAAFAYPLGNRKMIEHCAGRLDAFQRVFGMTIASLPFWFVVALIGWATAGVPSAGQTAQSLIVAISSGVIATTLFFIATDRAKGNERKLAAVEATQSGEVIFAVIGEVLLLSAPFPNGWAFVGLAVIVAGICWHSFESAKTVNRPAPPGFSSLAFLSRGGRAVRMILYALLACHAAVIYFWISDWDVLMTPVGLVVWVGGVAVSLAILHFRPNIHPKLRSMLTTMTAASVLAAVCSLIIEWAVRSMP